jgi:hypothetical protein
LSDRDRPKVAPGGVSLCERAIHDAADIADVLTGRELRHDTAPLAMDRHLRGDDVRTNRPGLRGVAGFLDDRG